MQPPNQLARRVTPADYRALHGLPLRRASAGMGNGPGTPVDLKLLLWGGSLLLLAVYLLGGGDPKEPLRRRKLKDGAGSGVGADAISALENLGYSRSAARKGVSAARGKGARDFDSIMREAMQVLG